MATKCQCRWIDRNGNPTPDENAPIGIALCKSVSALGVSFGGALPICAEHASNSHIGRVVYSWPGTDHEVRTEWTVEPFSP